MRKFVNNIALFMLPIILTSFMLTVPFYGVGYYTGELKELDRMIAEQRENTNIILGFGYNEQTPYYKLSNANYYQAPIIALGTSRVMQFKDEFFDKTFYNCGGAVSGNYNEYVNFLENLSYTPDTIILGLDAWVFNDAWNCSLGDYSSFSQIEKIDRDTDAIIKSIREDWGNGKWSFSGINDYDENMGFNGRMKDTGFMYDGSYYYGCIYRNPEQQVDWQFADTLDRVATGTRRFEWGEHIDNDTLVQLENLLCYCKVNNINVIGFLAPFAPTVYDAMTNSGNYGYLDEISPACEELFADYGCEYYDFVDSECFNVTDDYFVDGFHGSEIAYGYILEDMISNDSSISNFVDLDQTEYWLNNSFDGRTFYDPNN